MRLLYFLCSVLFRSVFHCKRFIVFSVCALSLSLSDAVAASDVVAIFIFWFYLFRFVLLFHRIVVNVYFVGICSYRFMFIPVDLFGNSTNVLNNDR